MKIFLNLLLIVSVINLISNPLFADTGEVQLVLGSDTAIWEGMSTNQYHCYYNIGLYTDPTRNAYHVMAPAFREQFLDSYGQPVKMTWWMMAGNIFRFASNKNIPLPNIMTLYLMKKYHGEEVLINGDELSLHYHTFAWTDYDADGKYWWNQSLTFNECREDFDITLAQFLLEENIFPVSFRSGWHYMDNEWQRYLDELLPYSMHNDWPAIRTDTTEPLDNTFDWSQAPEEFVPFQPSPENYQLPGAGKGWNVRSIHLGNMSQELMDHIFDQANKGIDQVACIWGHLPETDFLDNIARVNGLAQTAAATYPDVKFRYCTAIEAMQRWLKTADNDAPEIIFDETGSGDDRYFTITTNEPIFQDFPFVAIKTIYEQYLLIPCQKVGENTWQTTGSVSASKLAKAGVAVCDTVGNLSTAFINYLPDDLYIDNLDEGFCEIQGNWNTSSENSWGTDARYVTLTENDSAVARFFPQIDFPGYYNIFIQIPTLENPARNIAFYLYRSGACVDTTIFTNPLPTMDWVYITTAFLEANASNYLEMKGLGHNQEGSKLTADVAKFSPLVRDRDLIVDQEFLNLGEVSQEDTAYINLKVSNAGIEQLTISEITSRNQSYVNQLAFPISIPGMSSTSLKLSFVFSEMGVIIDTLLIKSDDPVKALKAVPLAVKVQSFFEIVDNEDTKNYHEQGVWQNSVAQAYGPSSRFAYLSQRPRANAWFDITLPKHGIYEIYEIVPTTVNTTNYALYVISIDGVILDSMMVDQNEGSGDWVLLGRYYLPADLNIQIKIVDTGKNTNSQGVVIRTDAIKFALIEEFFDVSAFYNIDKPTQFQLEQNYPNPFNASTNLGYSIPVASNVEFKIFNLMGQEVEVLVDEFQQPGNYSIPWDAKNLASGVYFYQLKTEKYCQVKKFMLIR